MQNFRRPAQFVGAEVGEEAFDRRAAFGCAQVGAGAAFPTPTAAGGGGQGGGLDCQHMGVLVERACNDASRSFRISIRKWVLAR